MKVVEPRSYSRNSGLISSDVHRYQSSRSSAAATARSFAGFRYECRKQMATDFTRARRSLIASRFNSAADGRKAIVPS